MEVVELIKPVIYGSCSLFLLTFFGWGIWQGLKKMGMFKRKVKVRPEILDAVMVLIISEEKTFIKFAEYISKFDLKLQEEYIEAYYTVKKLEGGI